MLAENSNYCLKNETEYQEQDPEELAETNRSEQSASSVQGRCAKAWERCKQAGTVF